MGLPHIMVWSPPKRKLTLQARVDVIYSEFQVVQQDTISCSVLLTGVLVTVKFLVMG